MDKKDCKDLKKFLTESWVKKKPMFMKYRPDGGYPKTRFLAHN